ncbi:proline racemase family protein [Acinetobacter bereziniae]|uniref:proline racemase family protein n=1 Tax=Acinetobacter bereziniae TaxID=106648 RepID=UPI0018FF9078|nr:proline racemase family protein [Acinetobacter bereziniae]MBJ8421139.1 proline racemase family protein [Acinetobacter bereziniae]MBJ8551888.1 proline racemase family protein [Acinetobacter bereziniae]MCU4418235.1 proline racemase family protein [Acinetobacter bereziniae]MCU4476467.1 proline racemase family protein [Acinetobacter bereziniae]MCU4541038.1 proline racemase family protein [Acinetobacter bereziniae]
MRWQKMIQLVDVHCEGEVGKVITGGVLNIPGLTMAEKVNYLNEVDDSLRRFVIQEPRGCLQISVNLLLPPTVAHADAAFAIFQADKTHPMSGSNCICVTTALLEMGIISMQEPITSVVLDTAAGLVTAKASCKNGRCESVSLEMMPAFVEQLDAEIEVDGLGKIQFDIAFGGVYYALIDVDQVNLTISPENAHKLALLGITLRKLMNNNFKVQHPIYPDINEITYVMFRNRLDEKTVQTCTTLPPGRVDRSPCGTGSSANLATMVKRGLVQLGDELISQSIIGGQFKVKYVRNTTIGEYPAIIPNVTGRAWLFGFHQLAVDPTDPLAEGFMVSDTWGQGII